MAMARKQFVAIADIVREHFDNSIDDHTKGVLESLARDLARFCKSENDAFDRERFLSACGVE